MDLLTSIDISAAGMSAQRTRLNVISMNLANSNTTRTAKGGPYRRKTVIFQTVPTSPFRRQFLNALERQVQGVKVTKIQDVAGDFKRIFDPAHPDADKEGYVYLPNVNLVQEMVQMLNANRSFEANASAVRAAKEMALKALDIGR
jgi:flagellar basal-body rod protein FlgC